MPLFFIISGMCMSQKAVLDKKRIWKMAYRYLLPYVVWTCIYLTLFRLLHAISPDKGVIFSPHDWQFAHAITICGIAPLWFLLALFIAEALFLVIKEIADRISKDRQQAFWLIICLILISATVISDIWFKHTFIDRENITENSNYLLLNTCMGLFRIFPTTCFVIIGYLIKNWIEEVANLRILYKWLILSASIVFQIALCLIWKQSVDVQIYILGNPTVYFVKAINGSITLIIFSQLIHSKIVIALGHKTKEIMILHYPPFYWAQILGKLFVLVFVPNIIGALLITLLSILGCLLIDSIMGHLRIWKYAMGNT